MYLFFFNHTCGMSFNFMRQASICIGVNHKKSQYLYMNWRKIAGDVLIVAAGALVALYVKEAMAKAKTAAPATK